MEVALMMLAAAYMLTGKFNKDTAQAAYKAGKEPPGLVKARMRHAAGGGRRQSGTGKPKGPGATRLLLASRWSGACQKAQDKGEDKLRRWQAWYAEQAPTRDAAWREKQQKRMARRGQRLDKWQGRWTRTKDTVNPANLRRDRDEQRAWDENTRRDQDAEQQVAEAQGDAQQLRDQAPPQAADTQPTAAAPVATGEQPEQSAATTAPTGTAAASAAVAEQSSTTRSSVGGIVDYQSAATALQAAAERVEQYRTDLSAMADGLGGNQWGVEVHGPIRDMDTNLSEIAGDYRDLAVQMQQQGDNVRDAEDAHPYVPGEHVVNA